MLVAAAGNSGASGAIAPANCNHVIGDAAAAQVDAAGVPSDAAPEPTDSTQATDASQATGPTQAADLAPIEAN